MIVRKRALFDPDRDADLLAYIEAQDNQAAAMRDLMRRGLATRPALDLGGLEERIRRVIREELAALEVRPTAAAVPTADEEVTAKIKSLFGSVAPKG